MSPQDMPQVRAYQVRPGVIPPGLGALNLCEDGLLYRGECGIVHPPGPGGAVHRHSSVTPDDATDVRQTQGVPVDTLLNVSSVDDARTRKCASSDCRLLFVGLCLFSDALSASRASAIAKRL